VDPKRFAHQVALESRYSIRKLDPESWYTLEIRPREGAPSSSVAVLAVPKKVGRVQVVGQPTGELRHALSPGRYTLQGVRELWFALPRSEGDGEARMELSVSPEEAGAIVGDGTEKAQ
jgi:serine/threonine-protein kinase